MTSLWVFSYTPHPALFGAGQKPTKWAVDMITRAPPSSFATKTTVQQIKRCGQTQRVDQAPHRTQPRQRQLTDFGRIYLVDAQGQKR
jgi:hypothetical protein